MWQWFSIFFRVACRQPREPAHLHPHVEIVPLGKRRADMLGIGVAFNPRLANAGALCGAVTALGSVGSGAMNFLA